MTKYVNYNDEKCVLCDNYATWECKTCHEVFCDMHWHETSKGKNVECSSCENKRENRRLK